MKIHALPAGIARPTALLAASTVVSLVVAASALGTKMPTLKCPSVTISAKVTKASAVSYTDITTTGVTCGYVSAAFLPDIAQPPFHEPGGWKVLVKSLGGNKVSDTWRHGTDVVTYETIKGH
jgi:hypothetical protein